MPPAQPRYHAMDSLRAVMMFLGLVIHTAMSYSAFGLNWAYRDPSTHIGFDGVVFFIHIFRMPVFFVISGFFAMLLLERGPRRMIGNRTQRILLPFIVAWLILFPLTRTVDAFAGSVGEAGALQGAVNGLLSGAILDNPRTMHLWFLYYLSMFFVAFSLAVPILRRIDWSRTESFTRRLMQSSLGPLIPALATAVTIFFMQGRVLEVTNSFVPGPAVFVGYGFFFFCGIFLYACRDHLDDFVPNLWTYFGAGLLFSGFFLGSYLKSELLPASIHALLGGLATWYLTFAFFGLFQRFANHQSPFWRYLSDSSYWVYLLHLPLTVAIPALLHNLPASALIKFTLTLVLTTAVCLLTYQYCVRYSFVGKFLNGRIPKREPSPEITPPMLAVEPVTGE
ncbi:MAG: acyltransferase family protein [Acidobacteriota bacterium]|nr:acyltransferase family protein [Acidobacteriota bacterium]